MTGMFTVLFCAMAIGAIYVALISYSPKKEA